jgi:hypothetical protein
VGATAAAVEQRCWGDVASPSTFWRSLLLHFSRSSAEHKTLPRQSARSRRCWQDRGRAPRTLTVLRPRISSSRSKRKDPALNRRGVPPPNLKPRPFASASSVVWCSGGRGMRGGLNPEFRILSKLRWHLERHNLALLSLFPSGATLPQFFGALCSWPNWERHCRSCREQPHHRRGRRRRRGRGGGGGRGGANGEQITL